MSVTLRRTGPLVVTFLVGFFLIFAYFLEVPAPVKSFHDTLPRWGVILVGFGTGVGAITLIRIHLTHISKRELGQWQYSIVALVAMFMFIIVGLITGTADPRFRWVYNSFLSPTISTTYAMWAFFISSATFRILRLKNRESAVLLLAGVLVMLSNVALGELVWADFPLVGTWIKEVPMMAVFRSLAIGVGLGVILIGLRNLLGLEKGYVGE
jgi:hypothetical protein